METGPSNNPAEKSTQEMQDSARKIYQQRIDQVEADAQKTDPYAISLGKRDSGGKLQKAILFVAPLYLGDNSTKTYVAITENGMEGINGTDQQVKNLEETIKKRMNLKLEGKSPEGIDDSLEGADASGISIQGYKFNFLPEAPDIKYLKTAIGESKKLAKSEAESNPSAQLKIKTERQLKEAKAFDNIMNEVLPNNPSSSPSSQSTGGTL
jgi:hypothetical protein